MSKRPTPQSLDTVTLEAAARVCDGLAHVELCADDTFNGSKQAEPFQKAAAAIRALAIKPTPAGEGEASVNFRDLGLPKPTEADIAYIKKHHPYMPFHAPAASPVQGVDYQDAFSVCHGALLVIGRGRQELDQVREYALEVADRIGKQVAEALIDATPQSPSTVDERVKK